ncbi:electron transfer flavoprotein subunit alpha, mitochondrial-like [Photinus pyralis]|nr:electron transfer flavoprotein subunit alpha, mitochondrial-like [Photinus pyralis]
MWCQCSKLLSVVTAATKPVRQTCVLVVAEHNTRELKPTTINTIEAATKVDNHLVVLLPGTNTFPVAKYLSTRQEVARVLTAENVTHDGFPEENLTETILATQEKFHMTHIFANSSKLGNSVLPRVAVKLDVPAITDIVDVKDRDTFVRPIYAGNAFMTLQLMDSIKIITVKGKSTSKLTNYRRLSDIFLRLERCLHVGKLCTHKANKLEKLELLKLNRAAEAIYQRGLLSVPGPLLEDPMDKVLIEPAPISKSDHLVPKYHKNKWVKSKLPSLDNATVVICGGRGLRTAENFKQLYELCYILNAAIGATKSAVDAGLAPRDIQIGQFGIRVAPAVYIGIGVSGESYHIAAIKDSKTIVAINNDPFAPIFKVADYGLVMDLFDAIPTIKSQLVMFNNHH